MTMQIPVRLRAEWEKRFPGLDGKWTHWLIIGDGAPLVAVPGTDLLSALDTIAENFGRFAVIMVHRAIAVMDVGVIEEENVNFVISHFTRDERYRLQALKFEQGS